MDWESLRAQILDVRRQEETGALKLDTLLPVMDSLGTLVRGALRQISDEFLYICDSRRSHARLQQAVLTARNIPESFEAFGTLLLSLCLREVKSERTGQENETASWSTFRVRFNALSSEGRRRVLEVLPESDLTPSVSASRPSLPDDTWIATWRDLVAGIPEDSFPTTWRKLIATESSDQCLPSESPDSGSGGILEVPHMILSRERERRDRGPLGTWLFRLASLKELVNPTAPPERKLVLPPWVIPSSGTSFLADLGEATKRLGGIPADQSLQELLEQVRRTQSISDFEQLTLSTSKILEMSSGWGGNRILIEGVGGATHLRGGRKAEARLAYVRMYNLAETKADAAMALANLAGTRLAHPDEYPEANALLKEALSLNPWSSLGRIAMDYLLELQAGNVKGRIAEND